VSGVTRWSQQGSRDLELGKLYREREELEKRLKFISRKIDRRVRTLEETRRARGKEDEIEEAS
jgi:hypothetical protein